MGISGNLFRITTEIQSKNLSLQAVYTADAGVSADVLTLFDLSIFLSDRQKSDYSVPWYRNSLLLHIVVHSLLYKLRQLAHW